MADYRLKQSGNEVQDILDNAALKAQVAAETERATNAEQTLQDNINTEEQAREDADAALQRNINTEAERAATAEQTNAGAIATERNRAEGAEETLQDNIDAEEQLRTDADLALQANIDAEQQARENAVSGINAKIPAAASAQNKLVDQNLMNSSIQTATAVFRGTFNLVSDLHLTVSATRAQIIEALASVIHESDNNDYCFVQIPVADEKPTEIASVDRYKFNGSAWAFEYLAGIKIEEPGFARCRVKPYLPEGVERFDIAYRSCRGLVRVRAWREGGVARYAVSPLPGCGR
jgi:hypothetical protein